MYDKDNEERISRPIFDSILSNLPEISRMRGWRMYARDGSRILSLWSDYGRMLLGYSPRGLASIAKSSMDRGLFSATPGIWTNRIDKMLHGLLPEYQNIKILGSQQKALTTLQGLEGLASPAPSLTSCRFLFDSYLRKDNKLPDTICIVLPIPSALSIGIIASKVSTGLVMEQELIEGIKGMTSIYALSKMQSEEKKGVISRKLEPLWKCFDRYERTLFSRSGPWLFPNYHRENHEEIFLYCLKNGLLISPDYDFPSSVPGDFDKGELGPLRSAAESFL
ncbi:MAG: hypothetical protein BWX81_01670 [Spirochaetes bacterium ADurb.Bin110]|nr:MAG: hypothetical protein BWX81_01670 [Spirochaetes bacterium ADurb.Bin110]